VLVPDRDVQRHRQQLADDAHHRRRGRRRVRPQEVAGVAHRDPHDAAQHERAGDAGAPRCACYEGLLLLRGQEHERHHRGAHEVAVVDSGPVGHGHGVAEVLHVDALKGEEDVPDEHPHVRVDDKALVKVRVARAGEQ